MLSDRFFHGSGSSESVGAKSPAANDSSIFLAKLPGPIERSSMPISAATPAMLAFPRGKSRASRGGQVEDTHRPRTSAGLPGGRLRGVYAGHQGASRRKAARPDDTTRTPRHRGPSHGRAADVNRGTSRGHPPTTNFRATSRGVPWRCLRWASRSVKTEGRQFWRHHEDVTPLRPWSRAWPSRGHPPTTNSTPTTPLSSQRGFTSAKPRRCNAVTFPLRILHICDRAVTCDSFCRVKKLEAATRPSSKAHRGNPSWISLLLLTNLPHSPDLRSSFLWPHWWRPVSESS